MRTAGALDGRCYYPNKFHEYTQVQLLPQAPGTALTGGGGRGDRVFRPAEGQCL